MSRLLVIVSGDYGELGSAMYFLGGLAQEPAPVLLLPAKLPDPGLGRPSPEVRRYGSLGDIVRALDETRPATVLLFSGYLLAIGRRLTLFRAMRLLRLLRRRGIRVMTSDPFIGLLQGPGSLRFGEVMGRGLAMRALASLAALRTYLLHRQLRDAWHVYPAPMDAAPARPGQRRLSYFHDAGAGAGADANPAEPRRWLFVLARVDWMIQARRRGAGFADAVEARLRDAVRLGREAQLNAPRELVEALRPRLADEPRIRLHDEEPYASYMATLLGAEYAFFWNYYSFSILHRVIALRPVFFFDEGHMPRIVPALREAGIEVFYQGWKPAIMPDDAPLEEARLAGLAAEARDGFVRIRGGLARGLSPRDLLERAGAA